MTEKKTRYALYHEDHGIFMGLLPDCRSALLSEGLSKERECYQPKAFDSEIQVGVWFRGFFTESVAADKKWKVLPVETSSKDYFEPEDFIGTRLEAFAAKLIMFRGILEQATIH